MPFDGVSSITPTLVWHSAAAWNRLLIGKVNAFVWIVLRILVIVWVVALVAMSSKITHEARVSILLYISLVAPSSAFDCAAVVVSHSFIWLFPINLQAELRNIGMG